MVVQLDPYDKFNGFNGMCEVFPDLMGLVGFATRIAEEIEAKWHGRNRNERDLTKLFDEIRLLNEDLWRAWEDLELSELSGDEFLIILYYSPEFRDLLLEFTNIDELSCETIISIILQQYLDSNPNREYGPSALFRELDVIELVQFNRYIDLLIEKKVSKELVIDLYEAANCPSIEKLDRYLFSLDLTKEDFKCISMPNDEGEWYNDKLVQIYIQEGFATRDELARIAENTSGGFAELAIIELLKKRPLRKQLKSILSSCRYNRTVLRSYISAEVETQVVDLLKHINEQRRKK